MALRAHGVSADRIQHAGRWRSFPVSLSYPAQSSTEQDQLLQVFWSTPRFDLVMGTQTPRHVPARRGSPLGR